MGASNRRRWTRITLVFPHLSVATHCGDRGRRSARPSTTSRPASPTARRFAPGRTSSSSPRTAASTKLICSSYRSHKVYLVEIKSWSGVISGDPNTWRREVDGKEFLVDSPLLLANRKAKKLIGLLKTQKALAKQRRPYVEAVVFLSRVGVRCRLEGRARTGVYLSAESERGSHPNILDLLGGNAGFDPRRPPQRIDRSLSAAFARAMGQAGNSPVAAATARGRLRAAQPHARDGCVSGLGGRTRLGVRIEASGAHLSPLAGLVRGRAYGAASRGGAEYQLLDGIAHDGILRVESLTNAEQGPALIFEHDPDAERLDRFLERRSANGLDLSRAWTCCASWRRR